MNMHVDCAHACLRPVWRGTSSLEYQINTDKAARGKNGERPADKKCRYFRGGGGEIAAAGARSRPVGEVVARKFKAETQNLARRIIRASIYLRRGRARWKKEGRGCRTLLHCARTRGRAGRLMRSDATLLFSFPCRGECINADGRAIVVLPLC